MADGGFLLEAQLLSDRVEAMSGHPFDLPAIRAFAREGCLRLHPSATFLVGENGAGKSTLLEALAIAAGFNAEGGSRNFNFATRESHSALHRCIRLVRSARRPRDGFFLRAESLFTLATEIERLGVGDAYGDRSLHEQSHGEAFLSLVTERFRGDGLYFMDEPEAALSPTRQMALLAILHGIVARGAQLVIATHSPILLALPNARILELGEHGIRETRYTETEHFLATRDFLNRYPRSVRELLRDDDAN